jgi:ketosteroid isomerase-like protein
MSQENVEIVRRFHDCWNRRDLAGILECADAEICFDWSESRGPQKGVYTGHEGVIKFRNELLDAFDDFSIDLVETIELDPTSVITVNEISGRGKGSGFPLRTTGGATLFRLRGAKLVTVKLFQSREEALEAVGLSE